MTILESDDPETFKRTMTELNDVVRDAFNRGDVEACTALYANDAVLFLPGCAPIEGRSAIEAFLGKSIAAGTKLISIDPIRTGVSSDVGYSAGTYRFDTPATDGSTISNRGKFVTIFQRQPNGSWQAVVDSLLDDARERSYGK